MERERAAFCSKYAGFWLAAAWPGIVFVCFFWHLAGGASGEPCTEMVQGEIGKQQAVDKLLAGEFKWKVSGPLVAPLQRPGEHMYSVKDPSIVRYKGRWHLFCTIRGQKRSHQIEYLSFEDWGNTEAAERHLLTISDGYYCAPQVFYFRPGKKWYLIYQMIEKSRKPALQPAYSTTDEISDANSWSKPKLLFAEQPSTVKMWLDFWVICDDTRAYLFFTSMNGKMWRAETKLADFPGGWNEPKVVLEADIFEAGHIYRLKGMSLGLPTEDKFLAIIEAEDKAKGRRYYKAYLADKLAGQWSPIAATKDKPFAGPVNIKDTTAHWTDLFSHGEMIRAGYDQKLEIDPANLKLLFQGVSDEEKKGKKYGQIPWRLGILEPAR